VVINNYEENVGHDLLDYMHIFDARPVNANLLFDRGIIVELLYIKVYLTITILNYFCLWRVVDVTLELLTVLPKSTKEHKLYNNCLCCITHCQYMTDAVSTH
jgi:hypothetical protein